jgi:predicted  nucleic acid-binding Zn-ribbon protein
MSIESMESDEKDAEIEKLKAELEKYQRSNKDHWDHLADIANELRYDNQVRDGHLDAIRDQRAEIEGLKARVEALRQIIEEDKALITKLCDALEDTSFDVELLQRARMGPGMTLERKSWTT